MSSSSSTLKITSASLIECGQNRISSRSVSWNSTGNFLAMASSDSMARLCTIEPTGSSREVLVVSGHTAPVLKTRFHPNETTCLCTAAADLTVRLWDVRAATQRSTGKIDSKARVQTVEWSPTKSSLLAVTDRNGTISVYDVRKLSATTTTTASTTSRSNVRPTAALHSFPLNPNIPEVCIFSPQGEYLIAGTSLRGEGVGELRIWQWESSNENENMVEKETSIYAAHCGPIYALQVSPNGKRLATGGSDSTVGLWDMDTMCNVSSFARRSKYICGVDFSGDNKLLAICSEDDGVDVLDAWTGEWVGLVNLGHRPRSGGAEEVAWHPKEYLLACARTSMPGNLPMAPVTVAKLSISASI